MTHEKRGRRRQFGEATLQHISGITEALEAQYPGEVAGLEIIDGGVVTSGQPSVCNVDGADPGATTAEVATQVLARMLEARRPRS